MFHRGLAFAAACLMLTPAPYTIAYVDLTRTAEEAPATKRVRRKAYAPARSGAHKSKNAPTRRRLKANRLHISRRVRRRHRRG
ncbi:hypothetical protein O4H52_07960 [Sphingomonadaceae bacterium G21617-S1]|nr:hypothetical protein [Sphingomonadaceae bacterium G21617-S1]